MKSASLKQIKDELKVLPDVELKELILQLARRKKENKEILTYLLFYRNSEDLYIDAVKSLLDEELMSINTSTYYWMKKTIRKVNRLMNKHIRFSGKPETETELRLHFCRMLAELEPSITGNKVLHNLFIRELDKVSRSLKKLHEDLQYDYKREIRVLKDVLNDV